MCPFNVTHFLFKMEFEIHVYMCCLATLATVMYIDNQVDGASEFIKLRPERSLQTIKFDQSERGGRKCHDFCSLMSEMCRNGGRCVIDEDTCVGRCVCSPGWTGKWCRDPVPPELKQHDSKSALSARKTDGHGQSETATPDYDTSTAERRSSTERTTIAASVFDRSINKRQDVDESEEKPSTSHVRSDSIKQMEQSTLSDTMTTSNINDTRWLQAMTQQSATPSPGTSQEWKACLRDCVDGDCILVNNVYKCKHRVDASDLAATKICGPGFECDNGVCDLEALKNNSYNCICESNYVGQFCNRKCPFDCGSHGYCDYHLSDMTFKCFCQWNYTGFNCSELVPDFADDISRIQTVVFHWYVVGISIAVVFLVVTSLVIAAYVMWKRRLVFVLKIVHYFQQYEEDDGKEYDAFVSYKSCPTDESFVLEHLYPRLENELNFKLCIHFRDFLPGDAIANNIVRAIESSRRTIMILSPEYVKSEWCRMEYQKAQHEMLKLKHRIIPIVLEDISEVRRSDKNLNSILNSVTYLEWPSSSLDDKKKVDKFWQKLELSLPKKASVSSTESTTSSLSSSNIPSSNSTPYTTVPFESSPSEHLSLPPPSPSLDSTSSPPRFQRAKKKDLKHFVDKLIRTKLYTRQDSTSSQAALVDAEATLSRSSCESVCEELTDSADSVCSTPVTAHSYLNETSADSGVNAFFTETSGHFRLCEQNTTASGEEMDVNEVFLDEKPWDSNMCDSCEYNKNKNWKENVSVVCEKDHLEGTECPACLQLKLSREKPYQVNVQTCRAHVPLGARRPSTNKDECANPYHNGSDNERVRISVVEGTDNIKIQRVYCEEGCKHCNPFCRTAPCRGSVKDHKDATNMQLVKRNKQGFLTSDRGKSVVNRTDALDTKNLTEGESIDEETAKGVDNCGFYIDVCENV